MNKIILEPELMINEVFSLPDLMRHHFEIFQQRIHSLLNQIAIDEIEKIYIIGCGDSYHAALASEMAFESFCMVDTEPLNGFQFLTYSSEKIEEKSLIIGVSASGGSARIVETFSALKHNQNSTTVAFVGKQNSPLAKNADHIVDVSVPFMGKCPGVRTYQANLLGLMIFSIMVGERKKIIDSEEAQKLLIELQHIPDIIDNHIQNLQDSVAKVAKSIKLQPAILFLGSGPSFGTAKFCAAKVCEACSIISFGQDLEEFAHVENLCYPDDMPIFIISPRGKSEWRAVEIAKFAQSIGKQVMILSDVNNLDFPNDLTMAAYLSATISEQFSPLVFHIPGTLLAAHLTKELNRKLFRSDQLTTRTRYFSNTSVYDIEY